MPEMTIRQRLEAGENPEAIAQNLHEESGLSLSCQGAVAQEIQADLGEDDVIIVV